MVCMQKTNNMSSYGPTRLQTRLQFKTLGENHVNDSTIYGLQKHLDYSVDAYLLLVFLNQYYRKSWATTRVINVDGNG